MSHFKLIAELERDIRNQVVIDQMKRLTPGVKCMIFARRYRLPLCFLVLAAAWTAFCIFASVHASAAECAVPGESCKVLILSPQEERLLTGQNGVLDTAAQARALDLGQFSVYLKTRIAGAPAGEPKPTTPDSKPAASGEAPRSGIDSPK